MTNTRLLVASVMAVSLLVGCDTFVSSKTRMQRAEQALADNDYGRAAVELRNVVQSEPNNVKARTKLVEALLLSNDRNALDAETAQLAAKGTRDAEAQAVLARVYLAKQDFQGLLDALDQKKLQLDAATEQLRRAQALLGLLKYDEAQAVTQQLSDHPNSAEEQLLYAQLLVVRGDLSGALAQLDKLIAVAPKDAHAWALKGYLHAQRGAGFEAVGELSSAIRNAGGQLSRSEELSTLALLVEQQLSLGNVKGAEASQKQLASLFPALPATSLAAAQVAFAKANYSDVVAEMQKLIAVQPELPAARLLLARALAAQGNQRQAESELQRLISAGQQNAAARVALAQVQLKLGENVQALQTLAPVAVQFGDQQSMTLLAQAQTALVESSNDMADLVAASKREPGNESLRVVTASTLLRAEQAQQALELLRDVQQGKFSAARVPLLLRAMSKQPNGGSVNAEAERIGNEHAHEPAYLAEIATFFSGQRDFPAASAWLTRALNEMRAKSVEGGVQASGELTLLRQLIAVELAADHKAEALNKAQAYRAAHPNDVSAILLEADLQMDLHDFNAAVAGYRTAQKRAPSSQLMLRLVKAKQAAGMDKPYQELIEWVRRYPEDVNTRFALADAYLAAKQQREAASEYEKVIDAQPANAMALNNLAWLYQQQGDKRAEPTARRAYALAASSPLVTDTLGWILLNGGKAEEALSLLTKAVGKAPQQPELQYHYAAALEKNGKAGEARRRLSDLLAKHPNFESRTEAEQLLARLPAAAG